MHKNKIFLLLVFIFLPSGLSSQFLPENYEKAIEERLFAFSHISHLEQKSKPVEPESIPHVIERIYSLIEQYPQNPFLYFSLGKLYRWKGDLAQQDTNFTKAGLIAGDDIIKHGLLGLSFERENLMSRAEYEYQEVRNLMIERGIHEIPLLSLALIQEGEENIKKKNLTQAERDFRLAILFSPSLPSAYLSLAKLAPRQDFFQMIAALSEGAVPLIHAFENQLLLSVNLYLYIWTSLIFASLGILIAFAVSYLSRLQHYLFEKLPLLFPKHARSLLAWAILITPILIRPPLPLLLLFGLVSLWLYFSNKERLIIFIFFLILSLTPVFLSLSSLLFAPLTPDNPALLISKAQILEPNITMEAEVRRMLSKDRKDIDLLLVSGLLSKRNGRANEAEEYLRNLISFSPSFSPGRNNLGNILFEKGAYDSAIFHYQKALDLNPLSPLAHYNLSQAYLKKLMFAEASKEFERASKLDFNLVQYVSSRTHLEEGKLIVLDELLPAKRLWARMFKQWHFSSLQPLLVRELTGLELYLRPSVSIFILLMLLFFQIAFHRKYIPSLHCQICGGQICERCKRKEAEALCPTCLRHAEEAKTPEMKEALFDVISRRAHRNIRVLTLILTIFLPGSAQIYLGRLKSGIIFIIISAFIFVSIKFYGLLIHSIPPYFSESVQWGTPYASAAAAIILYFLTISNLMKLHRIKEE